MTPRLAFLLAAVLALPSGGANAQKQNPVGVAPPQPIPLTIKAKREGRTEIPLRIYGKANEPLKYLIRTPPEHGQLTEPRPTEREAAVVLYEPPADLALTTDKFRYAVQSLLGVSASVEVAITITDQPPQLEIPDTIDFSTARAGATQVRSLEIRNVGGLIATGEVIVDAPWRIEGKTGYRLGAKEIAIFKILFAPTGAGDFEGVARYTSDPEHSTTLRGLGETSLSATPAEVLLQQRPGDPVRTGEFALTNHTDEPRTLQLKTDASLLVPPQITVPPRGKIAVPIQTAADNPRPLATEIRLEAPDFSLVVPVKGAALAAIIRAAPPAVSFGRLAIGQNANRSLELENIGGTPGEVSWQIGPPFKTTQNSMLLVPREKRSFSIGLETKKPGKYRGWVQFNAGAQAFEIPVEAEVASAQEMADRPAGPTTSETSPTTAEAPAPEIPEAPAPNEAPAMAPDWLADFRLPGGVKVLEISSSGATIEWPASLSPTTNFRIEMRKLNTEPNGGLKVTWVAPTGIPIERRGQRYAAILTDLPPGQLWTVRVLPLSPSGEAGERLFALDFATLHKPSRAPKISLVQILVCALLVLVGWQVVQRLRRRR